MRFLGADYLLTGVNLLRANCVYESFWGHIFRYQFAKTGNKGLAQKWFEERNESFVQRLGRLNKTILVVDIRVVSGLVTVCLLFSAPRPMKATMRWFSRG